MNLKSFGCSFVYGTDLPDDNRDQEYPRPSNLTWPALLAQDLGFSYNCYARGGTGNLHILNQVLSHAASAVNDFFVICWTFQDRYDFVDREDGSQIAWETIRPSLDHKHAEFYFRNLHSQYKDKLTTLNYMYTACEILRAQKIPYIMTTVDISPFDTEWYNTPAVSLLQDRVRHRMRWFDNKNFLEWTRDNQYPISPTWHPLEQAHEKAAVLMRPAADAALKFKA